MLQNDTNQYTSASGHECQYDTITALCCMLSVVLHCEKVCTYSTRDIWCFKTPWCHLKWKSNLPLICTTCHRAFNMKGQMVRKEL